VLVMTPPMVDILGWWLEGDRALGVALVAAKATEIRAIQVQRIWPTSEGWARQERAARRVQELEQAIRERRTV
jgi:hypothetical protein